MRFVALLFLFLPLAGCLLPPEDAPLQAGEAVYSDGERALHLRLTGPVSVLMGDGSRREANLLEAWMDDSPNGVTSMALDGDLRALWRFDECLYHGEVCESPAQVDWSAQGRLGLYGVGWMHTGLWQRVEYEDVDAAIERDGDALVVRRDDDTPRAAVWGLLEGRYEYADGGLFPTRIVFEDTALERVSWTPSGPLASVPAYVPVVPETGAGALFPGADEAVFADGSVQEALDALRSDPEAGAAFDAGCLQSVRFPGARSSGGGGLVQMQESETFTFGVGGPQRGAWSVTHSWDGVLPDRHEVQRTAPETGLGPCQPRPVATVSPRAFLDAAGPLRSGEPTFAVLSFEAGTSWTRDAETVPVLWQYREWGDRGADLVLEMDAHTGQWRVWRVPLEEVERGGLVQAAMAADLVSSLRNQ